MPILSCIVCDHFPAATAELSTMAQKTENIYCLAIYPKVIKIIYFFYESCSLTHFYQMRVGASSSKLSLFVGELSHGFHFSD